MGKNQLLRVKQKARSVVQLYGAKTYNGKLKVSDYNIPVFLKDGAVLLFNSCSRALIKLSKGEYLKLSDPETDLKESFPDKQLHSLISNQFIVPKEKDELAALERNYNLVRQNDSALNLTIAPTFDCNLACGYCFQGLDKAKSKITPVVKDGILEHIRNQKARLEQLSVTWYGGEPLMAKPGLLDLSDELISFCDLNSINYSASIVTNGYLLTRKTASELWSRRVTWAQVTIDGMPETHNKMRPKVNGKGSFEKITENIKDVLVNTPMAIHVRVNVGQDNIEQCEELLHFFHKEMPLSTGRFKVYFAPIDASTPESGSAFEQSLSRKVFNEKLRQLTALGQKLGVINPTAAPNSILGMCVAVQKNGLVIAANGDVHKCWETMHDSTKKIGTIFEINKAFASYNNQLWRHWSPYDNETCRNCKVIPICGGMCGHRFVYNDQNDEHSTPCPDWKWNTAENIFSRALQRGTVAEDDWLEEQATIDTEVSGKRHNRVSLSQIQADLKDKLRRLGLKDDSLIQIRQIG